MVAAGGMQRQALAMVRGGRRSWQPAAADPFVTGQVADRVDFDEAGREQAFANRRALLVAVFEQ